MKENPNTAMPEEMTESRLLYDGKVLRLYRDTVKTGAGTEAVREVVRHNGAVCIIPLDGEGRVVCERQYRYAQGRVMLEIPAGKTDPDDVCAEDAARRELAEETGYSAGRMIYMGLYIGSPAILDEKIHMFAALDLVPGEMHRDKDEFIEICRIPLDEMARKVTIGEICDGKTQAAVMRLHYMAEHGMI